MSQVKFDSLPPVSEEFFYDFDTRIQGIGGAMGTGKSHVLFMKSYFMAEHMRPINGVRKSKFLFFRLHYNHIKTSAFDEMADKVFPDIFIKTRSKEPFEGVIEKDLPDGTKMEAKYYFYAFDSVEAAENAMKSNQFTCAFCIEAQTLPTGDIMLEVFDRLGRYPQRPQECSHGSITQGETKGMCKKHGSECLERKSVIFDFPQKDGSILSKYQPMMCFDINYSEKNSWMHKFVEKNTVIDGQVMRKLYQMPPIFNFIKDSTDGITAVRKGEHGSYVRNYEAESYTRYNGWGYWENIIRLNLHREDKIQADVMGDWRDGAGGKMVYGRIFKWDKHVAGRVIPYNKNLPVFVGADQELENAWVFVQLTSEGVMQVIDMIENTGDKAKSIKSAVEEDLFPYVTNTLAGMEIIFNGLDPQFFAVEGGTGQRQSDYLEERGWKCLPAMSGKFTGDRIDHLSWFFERDAILFSSKAEQLAEAIQTDYYYRRNRSTGLYSGAPVKNSSANMVNALEYVASAIRSRRAKKNRSTGKQRTYNFI